MSESEILKENELVKEIMSLKKQKNAVILSHFYQTSDIQDIADFVGDSLGLSQQAAKTKADIIVFAGVYFMAETAKILSPEKKVIIPDIKAGCSLADSCKKEEFEEFIAQYPGYTVITYVNTTAEIKALSDISCTSSNAKQLIESLPKDEKIIFGPDRNLGNYINSITGRNMIVWNGACHVHEQFSLESIMKLKSEHQGIKLIAHPECELPVRIAADFIGSTSDLLRFIKEDENKSYIVATEPGILHKMRLAKPDKLFIPAPPKDSTCGCSECNFMKLITLEKIRNSLKFEMPEVIIDPDIIKKAEVPIKRMLEISEKLGL
jgi:quinolinate synthase